MNTRIPRIVSLLVAGSLLGASSLRCLATDLPGDRGAGIYNSLVYPAGAFLTSSGTDGSNGVGGRVINLAKPPTGSGILAISSTASATANTSAFVSAYNFLKNVYVSSTATSSYILYIPDGTYQVNGPLIYTGTNSVVMSGGNIVSTDLINLRLVGQSRTGTVIQLANNCPAFQTGTVPVINFNNSNMITTGSFNNCATQNLCENFTVNTGSGNPAAVGIQFQGANFARMANVSIISADGQGLYGLWIPIGSLQAYLKDMTISGFQNAVYSVTSLENEATFEHVTFENQKTAAVSIEGGGVSIRDMVSNQSGNVAAVEVTLQCGSCVLMDSILTGSGASSSAVVLTGSAYQDFLARNTTVAGYPTAVEKYGTAVLSGSFISEYCAFPVTTLFTPQDAHTFALPVQDTPIIAWSNTASWINVEDYRGGSKTDDQTVQAALAAAGASGSSNLVVYFPHLNYALTQTETIPANVTRVDFMFCNTGDHGGFSVGASSTNPLILVGACPKSGNFGKPYWMSALADRNIWAQSGRDLS